MKHIYWGPVNRGANKSTYFKITSIKHIDRRFRNIILGILNELASKFKVYNIKTLHLPMKFQIYNLTETVKTNQG